MSEVVLSEFALKVQRYYNYTPKLWSKEMVKNAVVKGKITAEEYKLITGEDYA